MPYERTIEIAITDGVVVRFSQSGRPIARYSVVLLAFEDGGWQTIRVYDNHLGTHHMHRYARQGGKQPKRRSMRADACSDSGSNRPSQGPLGGDNRIMERASPQQERSGHRCRFRPSESGRRRPACRRALPKRSGADPGRSPDASRLMPRAINERKANRDRLPRWLGVLPAPQRPRARCSPWWSAYSGWQITCAANGTDRRSCLASG